MIKVGVFDVSVPGHAKAEPEQARLVERAIAALDDDIMVNSLHPARAKIDFGAVKMIPKTNSRASGYTLAGPNYKIRYGLSDAPNLSKSLAIYTLIHEPFGHGKLMLVPLSTADMKTIISWLEGKPVPKFDDPSEVWKGIVGESYWDTIVEGVIDSVVEAISDRESPFQRRYTRRVAQSHYGDLKHIWLKTSTTPPVPGPDPDPLPDPDATDKLAHAKELAQEILNL